MKALAADQVSEVSMIFGQPRKLDTVCRVAEYGISSRAAMDLETIAEYTIERFGIEQSRRYRDELRTCFEQLLDNARLGRRAE